VPPKWIDEQRKKLSEDGVYTIQYFEVCNARAIYRPVDHPYMARFTKHTRIEQLSTVPPDFPLYACSITPFHVLRARVGVKEQMSGMICCFFSHETSLFACLFCTNPTDVVLNTADAMGLFTKCSRMTKQATKNGIQSLINVHITDGRYFHVFLVFHKQAFFLWLPCIYGGSLQSSLDDLFIFQRQRCARAVGFTC